jgi:hypothetical protein
VYRFELVSMINAETSDLCNTYRVVRPLIRDNTPLTDVKKRPFYMVDSTYTVASNPNTMRD